MKEILRKISNGLCMVAAVAVLVLLVFIALFENVTVFERKVDLESYIVQDVTVEKKEDKLSPCGVQYIYSFDMARSQNNGECLAFYSKSNNVDVFLGNTKVYSLFPDVENFAVKDPGNKWVVIPVRPDDMGSRVRVILSPVSDNVQDVEFIIGSRYSIFLKQFMTDLPMVALSILCVLIGLYMILMFAFYVAKKDFHKSEFLYIGLMVLCLGMWRGLTIPVAVWTFAQLTPFVANGAALAVLVGCVAAILYSRENIGEEHEWILDITAVLCVVVSVIAVVMYLTGALNISHIVFWGKILFVVAMATVVALAILEIIKSEGKVFSQTLCFCMLVILGIAADAVFYVIGCNTEMLCMLTGFVIYCLVAASVNVLSARYKAYIDVHTKLANKNRWDEITKEQGSVDQPTGIIMIDMNRLKHINDTMGHPVGDRILLEFANILRKSVEPGNIVCRWGGDEFAIMLMETTEEKVEECIDLICENVEKYNKRAQKHKISFSVGYAYTDGSCDITFSELLKQADNNMYNKKKVWYAEELNVKY